MKCASLEAGNICRILREATDPVKWLAIADRARAIGASCPFLSAGDSPRSCPSFEPTRPLPTVVRARR